MRLLGLAAMMVTCLAVGSTTVRAVAEGDELVENPTFADVPDHTAPDGWTCDNPHSMQTVVYPTEEGKRFLRIASPDAPIVQALTQRIPIPPDVRQVRVKTNLRAKLTRIGDKPWEHPRVTLQFQTAAGKQTGDWPAAPSVKQDAGWTPYNEVLDVPEDATHLVAQVGMWATVGTADWQYLHVTAERVDPAHPRAAGETRKGPSRPGFHRIPAKMPVTGAPPVDEAGIANVIHVSPDGNDAGDGGEGQPVQSLPRAIEMARAALGDKKPTRILLAPGVYRVESVTLSPGENQALRDTPLVIAGAEAGKVVIAGSKSFGADWTQNGDGTISAAWPFAMVPAGQFIQPDKDPAQRIGARRECVYVDGRPLRQVLEAGELTAGCFRIDDDAGQIIVRPGEGADPRKATLVEVADGQDNGLTGAAGVSNSLLSFAEHEKPSKRNVVLRNLVFRHSNQRMGNFFAVRLGDDTTVEDCTFEHFNSSAVLLGNNNTIRRVVLRDTGFLGLFTWGTQNQIIENIKFHRTNWRGGAAGYHGWAVGAIKFHNNANVILRDFELVDNYGAGIWWDLWCSHVLIERGSIRGQRHEVAVLLELSRHFTLRDLVIEDNIEGIRMHDSGDHTFENITLRDNSIHIFVYSSPGDAENESGRRGTLKGEPCFPNNLVLRKVKFISDNDPAELTRILSGLYYWQGISDHGIQAPLLVSTHMKKPVVEKMYQTMRVEECSATTTTGRPGRFVGPNGDLISYEAWVKALPDWKPDPSKPIIPPVQVWRGKK